MRRLSVAFTLALVGTTMADFPHADQSGALAIRGRILDALTHQPVSDVAVRLLPQNMWQLAPLSSGDIERGDAAKRIQDTTLALTDSNGHFSFEDVGASPYKMLVAKRGYLLGVHGNRRPNGTWLPIRGAADLTAEVTVDLWPAATISGKVVDASGKAVVHASIVARVMSELASYRSASEGITDADGAYRLPMLPAGDYVVYMPVRSVSAPVPAGLRPEVDLTHFSPMVGYLANVLTQDRRTMLAFTEGPPPPTGSPGGRSPIYVRSYYGAATSARTATVVHVSAGEALGGVDIAAQTSAAIQLTGHVTGAVPNTGPPMVRLLADDGGARDVADAYAAPDGTFTFVAVPTGRYTLQASQSNGVQVWMATDATPLIHFSDAISLDLGGEAAMSVTIGDHDLSNIDLAISPPVHVTGRVVMADGTLISNWAPFVMGVPGSRNGPIVGHSLAAGKFDWVVRGPGQFFVYTQGMAAWTEGSPGLWTQSVAHTGRDIPGGLLEIGQDGLHDVVVTLTNRPSMIHGEIRDASGASARDAAVVVFPTDRRLWETRGPTPFPLLRTETGDYRVTGLSSGEYFVLATDDGELAGWPYPDVLTRLAPRATRVRVRGSEAVTANLVVQAKPVQEILHTYDAGPAPATLDELIEKSQLIVDGVIRAEHAADVIYPDADPSRPPTAVLVLTNYDLAFREVFKKPPALPPNVTIQVRLPGGRRDHGSFITDDFKSGFPTPRIGEEYVLFLKIATSPTGTWYTPAMGLGESVFLMDGDKLISRGHGPVSDAYAGRPSKDLLENLRKRVATMGNSPEVGRFRPTGFRGY